LIFRQTQLYKFIYYNDNFGIGKKVLDCGAGGNMPPLALFKENGYETSGIEINDSQLEKANRFAEDKGMSLNINKGDMTCMNFGTGFFDCAYSYNSIFHMKKADIKKAVDEIIRVVKKGGLVYLNLLSVEDFGYGQGEKIGEGEFLQDEGDGKIIHTFYSAEEARNLFSGYEILLYQHRIPERKFGTDMIKQAFHDFILKI